MQTARQTDGLTLVMALLAACVTFTQHVVGRLMKATKRWWKTTWANTVNDKNDSFLFHSVPWKCGRSRVACYCCITFSHTVFKQVVPPRGISTVTSAFGFQPRTNTCRHHLRYFAIGFQLPCQKHWILSCKHTEGQTVNEGRTERRRERKRQRAVEEDSQHRQTETRQSRLDFHGR